MRPYVLPFAVDDLVVVGEQRSERVGIPRGDRASKRTTFAAGIRTHATAHRTVLDAAGHRHGFLPFGCSVRAPRALDEQRRALRLPQLDRARVLGVCLGAPSAARNAAPSARRASA